MKRLIIAAFAALLLVSNLASQAKGKSKTVPSTGSDSKTASYTGDGGKGMSLAILVPGASGLAAEQNYLPTMVQGVLVGDITKYSAIKVLDRQTLEKTLKETESGIYKNEADYGQLGQIANVDYALTGSIAKTGSGYAMRGIVAQRSGNTVETMARFYEAAAYDPSFAEATTRANAMSTSIRTGNLGENIRNDIAWRDEWEKILNDAIIYFDAHRPLAARVIYDPDLEQGETNYSKRTVDFSFTIDSVGVPLPYAYLKMMDDLNNGLIATKRNNYWNLDFLTPERVWRVRSGNPTINCEAELLNNNGKVISSAKLQRFYHNHRGELELGYFSSCSIKFSDTWTEIGLDYYLETEKNEGVKGTFTVKADDITDPMTIRIDTSGTSFPVEVMTLEEYLPNNGLPPLPQKSLRAHDAYKEEILWVEVPRSIKEERIGLSYRRPNLLFFTGETSGSKLFGMIIHTKENRINLIDTTHYRFPVSVAFLTSNNDERYRYQNHDSFEKIISAISDFNPGQNITIPKNCTDVLIFPKGYFKQKGIKKGMELSNK